jgi:hypothetical protein
MTSSDKRKFERIDSLNLSHISVFEDDSLIKQGMGRTLNISEAGILLEAHFQIEVGSDVTVTLGLVDELLDMKGKVVHLKPKGEGLFEIGIEFYDINDQSMVVLKGFIKTFSEQM